MFHTQGTLKNTCNLLAVLSGELNKYNQGVSDEKNSYPFPEIVSSGRLEVQTLKSPTLEEFRKMLESLQPNLVYIQGEQLPNGEVGSVTWGGVEFSAEVACELFSSTVPTTVYLELPNGERLAEAFHSKGVPYVIYWKDTFSCYLASQFHNTLFSVIQSSLCHTWDAFQLAHASLRLHCFRSNDNLPDSNDKLGPNLLGEPPKITVDRIDTGSGDDEEGMSDSAIKIYDDDIRMRFLVCGVASSLDDYLFGALEEGLNALLNIEIRGSKLHNRVRFMDKYEIESEMIVQYIISFPLNEDSALPPPLQAGAFSRGVVTMRCDLSTSTSAHISLLVSGSAQMCFDDQILENHIKSEVVEKTHLVHAPLNFDENKQAVSQPRRSESLACGAPVFEVCMKVPTWASQVLRQLAPEISYRSLVALGIAGIQGIAVSSFEKEDAERILYFCTKHEKDTDTSGAIITSPPPWFRPPVPRRSRPHQTSSAPLTSGNEGQKENNGFANGVSTNSVLAKRPAALRPIPHIRHQKMLPFSGILNGDMNDGSHAKAHLPIAPPVKHERVGSAPVTHRKSGSSLHQAKQIISLNPLPLKKHGCGRSPLHVCTEEEFLKDVMQFLILRGHNRLIPQGGLAEFPDAILNAKRLDLFNLYREVVTRGGFHVGNGINWKGQVFSKMRNHTVTNRMTGVGNTLKRHYETYLLEYELAHDDVDGECCLLCHSSAPGDWVNCGLCGEWAHFGCDRRPGLGAFKDYAKTDGLEYICPQCSVSSYKKKHKPGNGYS